jgi:prolipoprotein diacylglyceryltransferase
VRADGLALMGYGLTRFILDFWRDYDPASLRLGSQALAGVFLVAGLFLVLKGRIPDRSVPAPTSE